MKKWTILLFGIFTLFEAIAQEKMVVRSTQATLHDYKQITTDGFEVTAYQPNKFIDILVNSQQQQQLISQGFPITVTQTETNLRKNLNTAKGLNGYHTYEEVLAELQQIATDHPDICQLIDMGDSRGKEYSMAGNSQYNNYAHDIWVLKVSDNVLTEEDEPSVYFMGAHHAREPLSTEVAMTVLRHLINNYGTDDAVTQAINTKQIWFAPMVNADGHEVVVDEQLDLWWRKNIRDNNENGQLDQASGGSYPDGVDPNRNYGFEWGLTGSTNNPTEQTYHGPGPFSEPEVASMKKLLDSHHFVTGISYHTYSELILYPYGYAAGVISPDIDAISNLAETMAATIPKQNGGTYTPQNSWELYPAMGGTDDYSYGAHGIFGYTFELGTEFIPPANEVAQIAENNIEAAMILLTRADHSTLTGHITDAETGAPIAAEVLIEGIDDSPVFRSPYKSNHQYGTYYRILMPGNYNVTYKADGYITQTINEVSITSTNLTIQDITLQKATLTSISGTVKSDIDNAPIPNALITIEGSGAPLLYTNGEGIFTAEEIYEGNYSATISAMGYTAITEDLIISNNNSFDFTLTPSTSLSFESGIFENFWIPGGETPWIITNNTAYEGSFSARSGSIDNSQSSELSMTLEVTNAGLLSFYRKVSSEESYDFLEFYIDGIKKAQWSGEKDWEQISYDITTGSHTFLWKYTKDNYQTGGSDAAWIDMIELPDNDLLKVYAGPDRQICSGNSINLYGIASFSSNTLWTTDGDGTFTSTSTLNCVYTPGSDDIFNGFVTLTLEITEGNNSATDNLILTIKGTPETPSEPDGATTINSATTPHSLFYTTIEESLAPIWNLSPVDAGQLTGTNPVVISWNSTFEGEATLRVSSYNGCEESDWSTPKTIVVNHTVSTTEINTSFIDLYPIPADDYLTVQLPSTITTYPVKLFIYNIQGNVIQSYTTTSSKIQIPIKTLQKGIYFMRTEGIGEPSNRLFIKN